MNIKITIADDHPLVIEGLQNALLHYPHIKLIDTYMNGAALLEGLKQKVPDVLLLDIQLPDKNGDELAPVILKHYPTIKILTLTNFDSTLYANNMFKRGVHGYILKTAPNSLLTEAIETVYNGQQFIEASMKEKIEALETRTKNSVFSKSMLTPREKEVLQLIVNGATDPEIAEKLFLSLNTVMNYRTMIKVKLEVNNTASLVRKALTLGLVD